MTKDRLQGAFAGYLKLALLRVSKPMTDEDWLNLAETLEGQVEMIREFFGYEPVQRHNGPLDAFSIVGKDRDDWKRRALAAEQRIALEGQVEMIREFFGKETGPDLTLKRSINSVYGKVGQSIERRRVYQGLCCNACGAVDGCDCEDK